jgi:hypothetical protein
MHMLAQTQGAIEVVWIGHQYTEDELALVPIP